MDWSPPGSSVPGILQARILESVAIPFSRGSSQPRDQTPVSCIAGRFLTVWATSWLSLDNPNLTDHLCPLGVLAATVVVSGGERMNWWGWPQPQDRGKEKCYLGNGPLWDLRKSYRQLCVRSKVTVTGPSAAGSCLERVFPPAEWVWECWVQPQTQAGTGHRSFQARSLH